MKRDGSEEWEVSGEEWGRGKGWVVKSEEW